MKKRLALLIAAMLAGTLGTAQTTHPISSSSSAAGFSAGHYQTYGFGDWQPNTATSTASSEAGPTGQIVPVGIRRIGGPVKPDRKVGVAIVDSGVAKLADLNVMPGVNCSGDGGTDPGTNDTVGHGTAIASVIGALDNDQGVVGVAPGTPIYPVRIGSDTTPPSKDTLGCGLAWVLANHDKVENPIQVVNLSVGMQVEPTQVGDDGNCGRTNGDNVHLLICQLRDAGVVTVVAAGNATMDVSLDIPAAYREVLVVAAFTDSDGKPGGLGPVLHDIPGSGLPVLFADDHAAFFTNYGKGTGLMAPGVSITVLLPDGSQADADGTSFSAPHVAGVMAIIASHFQPETVNVATLIRIAKSQAERHPFAEPLSSYDKLLTGVSLVHTGIAM